MTENGTSSPITERSNISQMGQRHTIATGHASHSGQGDQFDTAQTASGLATALQPTVTQSAAGLSATGSAAVPSAATPSIAGRSASGSAPGAEISDQVRIRMPADGAYLSVLRTATPGLAARLASTLHDIAGM